MAKTLQSHQTFFSKNYALLFGSQKAAKIAIEAKNLDHFQKNISDVDATMPRRKAKEDTEMQNKETTLIGVTS